MKVVHISNADIKWGASRAGFGIFNALGSIGVDVKMIVQRKYSNDERVYNLSSSFYNKRYSDIRTFYDLLFTKLFTKVEKGKFSFGNIGVDITKNITLTNSDIIHLHFINEGLLSLRSLEKLQTLNKPIFWTLHDMWPFTGGCHYAGDCSKFIDVCNYCPYLHTNTYNDSANKIFEKKLKIYESLNLHIVAPSFWLKECASKSHLFKNLHIEVIPYAINVELYKPLDREKCRNDLFLPKNKKLLLFGAMTAKEVRKGYKFLIECLIKLYETCPILKDEIEILILGRTPLELFNRIPFKIHFLGRINNDEKMVKIYNSSDLFIAPSLEDNYPNTVMESLACGIPVVAFDVGGIPDMINHKANGYLAELKNSISLMEGILWVIDLGRNNSDIKENARRQILKNNMPNKIASQYLYLYNKALKM